MHFLTDGVSVSVVLGEESEPKPRACKPKRKMGEDDEIPALSSPSHENRVGLDLGLCYFFIAKNNTNVEDKKMLAKMSSKEYYQKNQGQLEYKQAEEVSCKMFMVERNGQWEQAWKNTYKKYSWWKEEMVKEVMTPKTHVLGKLKKYAVYALSYLDNQVVLPLSL